MREPLDEQAVPQAAVADREALAAELGEDAAHDAGAREDDRGSVGLQSDDLSALVGVAHAVELDLPIDLGAVQDGAVHDVAVVDREAVLDGGEVRDRAAHADDALDGEPIIQPREIGRHRVERSRERGFIDEPIEAEPLHVAHRADVEAEPLLDVRPAADRELGAAAARVEDDDRAVSDSSSDAVAR
jgi:hypothetical protein